MRNKTRYTYMPISDLMGYGHPSSTLLHKKDHVLKDDFPLFIDGVTHIVSKWAEQVSTVTGAPIDDIVEANIEPFYLLSDVYDALLVQDEENVFDLRI